MKKLLVLIMAGAISLGALAGCGKTEEEKVSEDLQAELEKDYENYQNSKEEKAKQQETEEAINAEYDDKIEQAKQTFLSSTDPQEIRSAGNDYITLTQEKQELMQEINKEYIFSLLPESMVEFRAGYFENKDEYSNYNYISIYCDSENIDNTGVTIYSNSAEGFDVSRYSEFTVIKPDGSTVSGKLSDFIKDDASVESAGTVCLEVQYVTDSKIVFAGNSSDWMTAYFYVFDFSGNTLELENTVTSDQWTYEYEDEALLGYPNENSDAGMGELFDKFETANIFARGN